MVVKESPQVAQLLDEDKLILYKRTNPQYNKDIENQLLFLFKRINLKNRRSFERELLLLYRTILTTPKTIDVYLYFLENGASTSREIIKKIGMSRSYAHACIEKLLECNLITIYTKVKSTEKMGGAPALVYGLPDVDEKEIQKASSRYMKTHTKLYMFVDQLYQRTLYEIKDEEIQYSKIVQLCKSKGNRGFHFMDMADEIALRLQECGVRVWR